MTDIYEADPLTQRELQVLSALAEGRSTQEIARALGIKRRTVREYLVCIRRKLFVMNNIQAINAARDRGLLENSS